MRSVFMKIISMFKTFIYNSKHIISISYKPAQKEYSKSAKIIIIGILVMGTLGFFIALIISLLVTGSLSLL